jgi:hypothetical protein
MIHLLDNVGAKLLNRKSTNVPGELTDNGITETVVVQIQNILNNLGSERC